MDVDCKDCGICCFSPINQVLVSQIKDEKTRSLFEDELLQLKELGIILNKVTRSGYPTKKETEKLMDAGLLHMLAPDLTIIHPTTGLRQIAPRLRHIPTYYKMDDEFEVPIFACVFFNPVNKNCEIFGKPYRPLHCRIYPFNELQKHEQLRKERRFPSFVKLSVLCDDWRLKGKLTSEQLHEIRSYEAMVKKFSSGMSEIHSLKNVEAFLEIRKYISQSNFLPVTDEDMKSIDATLDDLSLIMDHRRDLPILVRSLFSRIYGPKRVSPSLSEEQKLLSDRINKKIFNHIEWWEKIKLDRKTIIEMSVRMQEIFFRRMLAHRQKPMLNEMGINVEKLSHLW